MNVITTYKSFLKESKKLGPRAFMYSKPKSKKRLDIEVALNEIKENLIDYLVKTKKNLSSSEIEIFEEIKKKILELSSDITIEVKMEYVLSSIYSSTKSPQITLWFKNLKKWPVFILLSGKEFPNIKKVDKNDK